MLRIFFALSISLLRLLVLADGINQDFERGIHAIPVKVVAMLVIINSIYSSIYEKHALGQGQNVTTKLP